MKCFQHQSLDAIGACAHCGRGVCVECAKAKPGSRLACSVDCDAALTASDAVMRQVLEKSGQSLRASAFYCYVSAVLSAGAAVGAWYWLPSPFLIYFTGACAVVLVCSGVWYSRAARNVVPAL